jgi:hypothetical protein
MSGPDASSGEMPRVPIPGRAGRDQDDLLLDMILDRRPLPPDAPTGMHALADKLVGLAAAPDGGELPGEAAAMAAFVRSGSPASTLTLVGEPPEGRRGRRLAVGRARLTAAAAAIVVILSGTAAAAYAGVLPASVQNFAHRVIDAPGARHAVQHGDSVRHQSSHPGSAPPSPLASHPAKPGKHKGHKGSGHRGNHGQPAKEPKPSHPPKPPHPAHPTHPASG